MSRIGVNSSHVKRFLEDSRTMQKASLGITEGETAIISLVRNIEREKQNIDRLIQNTRECKKNTTSTLSQIKRKIVQLQNEIRQKELELSELKSELLITRHPVARALLNAKIATLQAEITSLKSKLSQCKSVSSQLQTMKANLDSSEERLTVLSAKLNNAKSALEIERKKTEEVRESSKHLCEKAIITLEAIINVIQKYLQQEVKKAQVKSFSQPVSTKIYKKYPTRTFYSAPNMSDIELNVDGMEKLTQQEKQEILDNRKAFEGSLAYLEHLGVDFASLDNAKTFEEQKNVLINSGFNSKDASQIISIYNGEFLSETDGSHTPFYSTAPQTAGDSYEFHRFFVNLREGKETTKEVPFDLTPYKGRSCTFLGYNETIKNDRRETDVVRIEGNREIHEELKIGRVFGKKGDEDFRQEVYGDDLRLRLNPNQEQEYRIRRNSKNQKCLLDDKKKVEYLYLMAQRHPGRVRVYFNDKMLSLQDMEAIIN